MPTTTLRIPTKGQGLQLITGEVHQAIALMGCEGDGVCTVFIQHTSASLLIQENADPQARADLEAWLGRQVPEQDPIYTHTAEGPDDMPAHIRAMLTATSVSIPIEQGRLCLGQWQGIYLWEHRRRPHTRKVSVHVLEG